MACWLDRITQLYDAWAIRVLVLFSFALHVVLILFAGIRRRKAIGFRRPILWVANQSVDWTATYVLGNLSLGSTSQQQQLVAFWASFLLVHLGRPDNVSAYSLEDDKLSGRQVVEVISQFIGAFFVLFKHIPFCDGGALFPATPIMFAVGFAKYVERTLALWWGDFGSIRRLGKKLPYDGNFSTDPCGGRKLDDEQALLVAHGMFPITKGAFADYSVVPDPLKRPGDRRIPHGWKDMWKVVEMELSLMYDILYTKAAIVHTWRGYLLRFISPPLTALAFLLFWFYNKAGQRRVDVVITYILLTATFLVDLRWLLGALGSTWTYAFLNEMACTRWCWLRHELLCTGRWHRLRRVVVSLDPGWLLGKEPASYRKWSGIIGQYNLLHECTHDTESRCRTLAKNVGLEDSSNEYQYHYCGGLDISKDMFTVKDSVGRQLFEWIRELLKEAYPTEEKEAPPPAKMAPLPPAKKEEKKPEKTDEDVRRRRKLDEALDFAPELGEDILVLHIATDVFLRCSDQNAAPSPCVKKAIEALSDYMMFLVAVRPDMVPGLKLSSLHKTAREALKRIWGSCPSSTAREKKLACILRNMEKEPSKENTESNRKNTESNRKRKKSLLYDWSIILSDGARLANVLLGLLKKERWPTDKEDYKEALKETARIFNIENLEDCVCEYIQNAPKLLQAIFRGWVRMLIYVSVRCSRDSHAKQLSRGGELTTIVWILAEHASIFGIDDDEND